MRNVRFKKRKGSEWYVMLLSSMVTGIASFLIYTIQNGGMFTLNTDFNLQQIPFTMALHRALEEGNPGGWIWNYDLGGSIIQSFSFYEMGSPFFWLSMLFPADVFPYLIPYLYVLKYITAACTAFIYIRRMVQKPSSAVVGAVLYAFSGFQAVNLMFYHFHDVVAFFPLLLTGMENMHEHPERKGFFIIAVAVNCLVNYFFFVQEVIFCALYFFFRFRNRANRKQTFREFFRYLFCGLWGTCIAAVLFVPSVLYIAGSSRAGWVPLPPVTWPRFTLYVLRGMLFPGEAMNAQSSLYDGNNAFQWMSVGCYLPMTGMVLVISYIRRKKDRLSGLIILLLILSVCPIGASAFYLFSAWYYRWWYFLVLAAALASARVIDSPEEYSVCSGVVFSAAAVIALYLVLRFLPDFTEGGIFVNDPEKLDIYAGVALSGILLTGLLQRQKKIGSRWLLFGVCGFAALTTALTTGYYGASEDQDIIRREIRTGVQLETEDPQYRYAQGNNILNMTGRAAGTSIFSSTISTGSLAFDELFDYHHGAVDYIGIIRTAVEMIREEGLNIDRLKEMVAEKADVVTNLSLDKGSIPGLYELLGGRYHVSYEEPDGYVIRKITADDGSVWVWEKEACPIGFAVSGYILEDNLTALRREQRGAALLRAAVIRPEDEAGLAGLCERTNGQDVSPEEISRYIRTNQENRVTAFSRNTEGFRCRTAFGTPAAVYFSVPYDDGWTARIDDREETIIDSGGMMLLPVPAGDHEIVFSYETPGYRIGKWISIIALAAWLIWSVIKRTRNCSAEGRTVPRRTD